MSIINIPFQCLSFDPNGKSNTGIAMDVPKVPEYVKDTRRLRYCGQELKVQKFWSHSNQYLRYAQRR